MSEVTEFVRRLEAPVRAGGYDVVGLYLHGSAVLGGFRPESSDIDVLAVVTAPGSAKSQRQAGKALRDGARDAPAAGLELSVVTAATAGNTSRGPGGCPFEVHVSTVPGDEALVIGAGHPGDPDLILHFEVARLHGLAVMGAPPSSVFTPIPEEWLKQAIMDELDWSTDHAPLSYAVLNACRALRFAADRQLVSKVDAAFWYLRELGEHAAVVQALDQQERGVKTRPLPECARRFVEYAKQILHTN
jgi:predicted nucleotidyltransferase